MVVENSIGTIAQYKAGYLKSSEPKANKAAGQGGLLKYYAGSVPLSLTFQ